MSETCEACKFFAAGKGGAGYRAMVAAMAATGNRYHPSGSDMAVIMTTDKHGQCVFNPDGVAKYKSDWCGQYRRA